MDNNTSIITEVSDSIFHFNRTSIYTFIKNHPTYSGTMYLLINESLPISNRNLQALYSIYQNIQLVNVLQDDDFSQLVTKLKSNRADLNNCVFDYMRFVSFKLNLPEFFYFSSNCLFMKPLFDEFTNVGLSLYSDPVSGISSNLIYQNGEVEPTFIQKLFKGVFKGNSKKPVSPHKLIDSIKDSTYTYSLIDTGIIQNSNNFTNAVYSKYSSILASLKCIIFDDLSTDMNNKTNINGLWLHKNKEAVAYLNKPINTKLQKNILLDRDKNKIIKENTLSIPDTSLTFDLDNPTYLKNINKKIKLAIVTGVWKRPDVFEYFAKGVKELEKLNNFKITTIVSGSEGDTSRKMVEAYGFTYIEIPNIPLSTKMNAPLQIAKELKVDYVLCMGSDDIIHPDVLTEYLKYMRSDVDYIGVTDFYFYDTTSKRSAYWGGYREKYRLGHTCGAGRALSSSLLDKWNWTIWEYKHDNLLDTSMQIKLDSTQHTSVYFSLKSKDLYGLDIKSSVNMTPFTLWDNTQYIDSSKIKNKFDYLGLN